MFEALKFGFDAVSEITNSVTNLFATKAKTKAQVEVATIQLAMVKEQTVQMGVQKDMMEVQTVQQKNIIIAVCVVVFLIGIFYIASLKIKND
jgi:hypothetical protein